MKSNIIPRGFLRIYILKNLKKDQLHGYSLMKKIEEETGFWKPTAGSIYPTLKSLQKMGLIEEVKSKDRKNLYRITKNGIIFSNKFEKSMESMHDRFSEMVSEILKIDKNKIKKAFEEMRNKKEMLPAMVEMKSLLMKMPKSKTNETKKIIEETNKKLRKVIGNG